MLEWITSNILRCSISGEFKNQTALEFRWSTVALILEKLYASTSSEVVKLWSAIAPVLKKPYATTLLQLEKRMPPCVCHLTRLKLLLSNLCRAKPLQSQSLRHRPRRAIARQRFGSHPFLMAAAFLSSSSPLTSSTPPQTTRGPNSPLLRVEDQA
jgi:hypothetical protein